MTHSTKTLHALSKYSMLLLGNSLLHATYLYTISVYYYCLSAAATVCARAVTDSENTHTHAHTYTHVHTYGAHRVIRTSRIITRQVILIIIGGKKKKTLFFASNYIEYTKIFFVFYFYANLLFIAYSVSIGTRSSGPVSRILIDIDIVSSSPV